MTAFLTAHGQKLDIALPDGNCLFRALSKQMTGDPSNHPQLRKILIDLIASNAQVFGRGWTVNNCSLEEHVANISRLSEFGSHAEIKAAASLTQAPVYVATDSLRTNKECAWTVFTPFPKTRLNKLDTCRLGFVSESRMWYELAYTNQCHHDGVMPLRTDIPSTPPIIKQSVLHDTINLVTLCD